MAKQCKGKTQTGKPCRMKPIRGGDYCFSHSPKTRRAQAEARKRGGENRHVPHFADPALLPATVEALPDAHQLLVYTLKEVSGMDNTIARARVLIALFESFVRSFEIGEIEARLSALELARNEKLPKKTHRKA
jgi:hypothetical protein